MSSWLYDEFRQIGTDFEDSAIVENYDRNQQSATIEKQQALITKLGITAEHTVIDLGCGTGTFATQAALVGATVHAVDVSASMLTHAQRKAQLLGVNRIQFHHQGFLTYEHVARSADFIVTQAALHHLPDFWKMVAFLRMADMLKIGGVLYLWDAIYSFPPANYQIQINAWIEQAAKPAGVGWTATDFVTHVRDEYTTFSWVIEQMLEQAGFAIEALNRPTSTVSEYVCRSIH